MRVLIAAIVAALALAGCRRASTASPAVTTQPMQGIPLGMHDRPGAGDKAELLTACLRAIEAEPDGVPRVAYQVFWQLDAAGQRELLLAMTNKSHPLTVAALLRYVGTPDAAAAPTLTNLLDDPNPRVARCSAELLYMMLRAGIINDVSAKMDRVLDDPSYDVPIYRPYLARDSRLSPDEADAAARWLSDSVVALELVEKRAGVEVNVPVPDMIAATTSPDAKLRLMALQALVDAGAPARAEAAQALAAAGNDPADAVRSAVPGLLARLAQPDVRAYAAQKFRPDLTGYTTISGSPPRLLPSEGVLDEKPQAAPTPRSVPELVAAATQRSWASRIEALQALVAMGPAARTETLAALTKAADSPGEPVREAVPALLLKLGGDAREIVPVLVHLLGDSSDDVCSSSAAALASLGAASAFAIPELIAQLEKSGDERAVFVAKALFAIGRPAAARLVDALKATRPDQQVVRDRLIALLGRFGSDARAAIPLLTPIIRAHDDPLRAKALDALKRIGLDDPSVPAALFAALSDPDDSVRDQAEDILEGDEPAALALLPKLSAIVKQRDHPLRDRAVRILAFLGAGAEPALPGLVDVLQDHSNTALRLQAAGIIGQIGPPAAAAAPALVAMLKEGTFQDSSIPDAADRALVQIGPGAKEQLPALIKMLASPKSADQRRALDVIEAIGPDARPAVPALAVATTDPNSMIHQRATLLLLRLQPDGDAADSALLETVRRHDYQSISLISHEARRPRGAALSAALADLAAHSPDPRIIADARTALTDMRRAEQKP